VVSQAIDLCPIVECCLADAITVTASASPDQGVAPLTVNFSSTAPGGTTYLWRFGDGASSTAEDPSHTFVAAGFYLVELVAGCVRTIIPVAVRDTACDCVPSLFPDDGIPDNYRLRLENGDEEFTDLNGTWDLPRNAGCSWRWYRDGWEVSLRFIDGPRYQVTATNLFTLASVTWINASSVTSACDPANEMEEIHVVGTGTTPTFIPADEVTNTSPCVPCPVTVQCCTEEIPGSLTVSFAGGISDTPALIVWNGTNWSGVGTLCGKIGTHVFECLGPGNSWRWTFTRADGLFGGSKTDTATATCSPFDWTSNALLPWADPNTCTGAFTVNVS
jgi:hypothetical protein